MPNPKRFESIRILYDGECPFCAAYVSMARLRSLSGAVDLIDARERPDLVSEYAARGMDIDAGMIADLDGTAYFGGEAMWAINALVSRNPLMRLASNRAVLVWIYPALRAVRNATVRLLGHSAIRA